MTKTPNAFDWYTGDPVAIDLGRRALAALDSLEDDDLRGSVALQQKKWGEAPSGTLSPLQWDRLLTESGVLEDVAEFRDDTSEPEPSRSAEDDASSPGQRDASLVAEDDGSPIPDPPARNATTEAWREWAALRDPAQADTIATLPRAEIIARYIA